MSGFIKGADRNQATLFPERLDDYIAEESAVRVIDVFVDELDRSGLGFRTEPSDTGRPGYDPAMMLKLFIYGYLNRLHSGRRLEREAQRNVELMWLTGRLAPDFKTISDFRKDNGEAKDSETVINALIKQAHKLPAELYRSQVSDLR
jgi:transposase